MKKFKKLLILLFVAIICFTIVACEKNPDGNKDNSGKDGLKISAELLDGKVANLLGASGIAIENKGDIETVENSKSVAVTYSNDESEVTKGKQPNNELVKVNGNEVTDVRFHDGNKGYYRDWNAKYGKHHHKNKECTHRDCNEPSDELLEEEQAENTPTIISLGARVNKMYNAGDFTFMCVSSEIEGQVDIVTKTMPSDIANQKTQMMYATKKIPTVLNIENSYDVSGNSISFSYIKVKEDGKEGMILVKASTNETSYHTANYWSDDYNQSYIIDNATGKTYSLSEFPYIYSVENGVIKVTNDGNFFSYYSPKIVDGELTFKSLFTAQDLDNFHEFFPMYSLVDKNDNVVLFFDRRLNDCNEYGEIKVKDNLIISGINEQTLNGIQDNYFKSIYPMTIKYHKGSDGLIYRLDLSNGLSNIPVHVLSEQGEWEQVPETSNVNFANGFICCDVSSGHQRNVFISKISGGFAYFSNCVWKDWLFGRELGNFSYYGVAKMPTEGGNDTELEGITASMASDRYRKAIVYRIGTVCMIYENENQTYVLWNRLTGEKFTLGGSVLPCNKFCYVVDGDKYISLSEDVTGDISEFLFDVEIKPEAELEEYYDLLVNKI